MKSSVRSPATAWVALVLALPPCAFSQAGVVGTRSPDGKISFLGVEEFQIEGSHRVRLLPLTTRSITPEDAKRLPRVELNQISAIGADESHHLVRLDDN